MSPGWKAFTCACLLVGALLRFAWVGDVEYKDDEDQIFRYSQAIPAAQLWPALGTTSGVREIRHPAFGIWCFAILARTLHLHTPLALTRSVQALSLTAVALLFWFAWRLVPFPEREIWLWTAALTSVSLVAVLSGRKIWIPDLLPIFAVVLLVAWRARHTRLGALVWGMTGALIGQVQMTGFFYAAGVAMGTALLARRNVRWRAWLAGSAWGAIPALPWLSYLWLNHLPYDVFSSTSAHGVLSVDFFRMAFDISLSQTADFNVGGDFREYLTYPVLFGVSTHGADVARFVLDGIGTIALVVAAAATCKRFVGSGRSRPFSDIDLCFFDLALTGALFSIAGVANFPHHHRMVFPLEYLWIPVVVLAHAPKPRAWLAVVWLCSGVSSLAFLQFIHQHCGAPGGDYGISYRCQDDEAAQPAVDGIHRARPGSPDLEPLIRPGQEEIIARMLGRGDVLPGACRFSSGQVDHTSVSATYACDAGGLTLHLVHPNRAPREALHTTPFAVVVVDGSPPPGFLAAIGARVHRQDDAFEWLLEAGRETSPGQPAPGPPPYGYLPVLTSRQLLLRMAGGAVVLLLLSPWWATRTSRYPVP